MRARPAWALALALIVGACTSGSSTAPTGVGTPAPPPPTSASPVTTSPSSTPTGATIAGAPLPRCTKKAGFTDTQTVSFVADGHVWAMDPSNGDVSCLWPVADPGPFIWGPLGDRVLLGGLEVRGGAEALTHDATEAQPVVADWGHPVGIAIVFAEGGDRHPQKLLLEDNKIERLDELPAGTYLDVAYHPSGLALAFVIERNDRQSIWLSTNEGKAPRRLVFTKSGTLFTDIEFSPDGQALVYTAHHPQGYAQVHSLDLSAPGTLLDGWRSKDDVFVRDFAMAPRGRGFAVDVGEDCENSSAVILDGTRKEHPALPGEQRPTSVLGWLDRRSLLVGAGGCGAPMDLFAVDFKGGQAKRLVVGVDAAVSRAPAPPAPTSLPKVVEEEAPPSGVG